MNTDYVEPLIQFTGPKPCSSYVPQNLDYTLVVQEPRAGDDGPYGKTANEARAKMK